MYAGFSVMEIGKIGMKVQADQEQGATKSGARRVGLNKGVIIRLGLG